MWWVSWGWRRGGVGVYGVEGAARGLMLVKFAGTIHGRDLGSGNMAVRCSRRSAGPSCVFLS